MAALAGPRMPKARDSPARDHACTQTHIYTQLVQVYNGLHGTRHTHTCNKLRALLTYDYYVQAATDQHSVCDQACLTFFLCQVCKSVWEVELGTSAHTQTHNTHMHADTQHRLCCPSPFRRLVPQAPPIINHHSVHAGDDVHTCCDLQVPRLKASLHPPIHTQACAHTHAQACAHKHTRACPRRITCQSSSMQPRRA